MKDYEKPKHRSTQNELDYEIDLISHNPIMSCLLNSVSGLLAILNHNRQILAVNHKFLKMLGIEDPDSALGLRPGEALHCSYVREEKSDCGTTQYCSTCGAAIAIVSALKGRVSSEKICTLNAFQNGKQQDLVLLVKGHPVDIDEQKFVLLFIQDITQFHNKIVLERTFFHDIKNLAHIIMGASELLLERHSDHLTETLYQSSLRLNQEIEIQNKLMNEHNSNYKPNWQKIEIKALLKELKNSFVQHPLAVDKKLEIDDDSMTEYVLSDITPLLRILCNMILNALEASGPGDVIKLWIEEESQFIVFYVWNKKPIPEDVQLRIFSRNFSTKGEPGRGIGTFSMKLFGEKILGGKVSFTSSPEQGTSFYISLPRKRDVELS